MRAQEWLDMVKGTKEGVEIIAGNIRDSHPDVFILIQCVLPVLQNKYRSPTQTVLCCPIQFIQSGGKSLYYFQNLPEGMKTGSQTTRNASAYFDFWIRFANGVDEILPTSLILVLHYLLSGAFQPIPSTLRAISCFPIKASELSNCQNVMRDYIFDIEDDIVAIELHLLAPLHSIKV